MKPLEDLELVLRRARDKEVSERVQDLSTLHVLDLIIEQLHRLNLERR
jgi:hypothetical protein